MRAAGACPGGSELSRAVGEEAGPALEAHLARCPRCRREHFGLSRAVALARELPVAPPPPAARREEVRTALLAAAPLLIDRPGRLAAAVRGRRRTIAILSLFAALSAVAWLVPARSSDAAASGAQALARPLMAAPPEAAPQPAAASARMAPAPRAVPRVAPSGAKPRPRPGPPARARTSDEVGYDSAWSALRGGSFQRAAREFERVRALAPDGALAEDAAFWRAVSLARARRGPRAIDAFRQFLRAHPRSGRAGEASAALGWLLLDARQVDEARRRFTAALDDPSPVIRVSAQNGLDAIRR